ncbi:MAG: hypothetical protein RBS24_01705 [Bacilli bacterium]|nr:hypothetical protein [Bacilli bacterium]
MSSADIIILVVVVLLIVGVIIFLAYQNKRSCAGCAYAKNCETFCAVIKKKEPTEEIE